MAFRFERDSMGEVEVPHEALYGAQTQRAVNNFTISSEIFNSRFIEAILIVKGSAATANVQLQLLSENHGKLISEAVNSLLETMPKEQFPVPVFQTGSGTSTNMNVNEVIAGMIRQKGFEISPNDHVNLGQSSNDVIPTAMAISASKATVTTLLPALTKLAESIRLLQVKYKGVIKTGRTHLMDAMPIPFSEELEAWATAIDESIERFTSTLTRINRLPLGGTAVGSGVNCHPDFSRIAIAKIAAATGLDFTENPSKYKGLSSLDTFVELSGQLRTNAVVLYKIANDLRFMNSGPNCGFSDVRLPALQPGSSIMPAKVNPVIPEAVCQAMAQAIGNDTAVVQAGLGGNFQLNTMLPLTIKAVLESISLLAESANSLRTLVFDGLEINKEKLAEDLAKNPILVTALNPVIGYLKAAEIGKIAQEEKRSVLEVALEHTKLSREELETLLDPIRLANPHTEQ